MLKLFPLPPILEAYAQKRIVNVALFGNGLSLTEWDQLDASYWRHHGGFAVNLVNEASRADVLAIHGPLTKANWPFFVRWMEARSTHAKIMVVGSEIKTRQGKILDPLLNMTEYNIDLILTGHPPTPAALKDSLAQLREGIGHV